MNRFYRLLVFCVPILLFGCSSNTQKIEVSGQLKQYPNHYISLYQVSDGELQLVDVQNVEAKNLFHFVLPEGKSGFYYLGVDDREKTIFSEIYLRKGDKANLVIEQQKLLEESLPEPDFANWQNRWKEIFENNREVFFRNGRNPEKVQSIIEKMDADYLNYINSIQSTDKEFNKMMKLKARVEYERYCLQFFSMASKEAAQIILQQAPFKRLVRESFESAELLLVNKGGQILETYPSFLMRAKNQRPDDYFQFSIQLFKNDSLKGQLLKNHIISRKKSGKDYERLMNQYGKYLVTDRQKSEMEAYKKEIMKFATGTPAIDFSYPDATGKIHALSDYKGKVVLVDVWATWCAPCKAEIPHLEKLIEHYQKNPDVAFIGVSIDKQKDKSKWKAFVKEHGLKGVQLIADQGFKSKIIEDYEITGVPRFMLFDKEGKIVSVNSARPSSPLLKQMIDELL